MKREEKCVAQDLVARLYSAARASFEAERYATKNPNPETERALELYSLRELNRRGVMDELITELGGHHLIGNFRATIEGVASGKEFGAKKKDNLDQIRSVLHYQTWSNQVEARIENPPQSAYYTGLACANTALMMVLDRACFPEDRNCAPGISPADAVGAISLLRGPDEAEVFLGDLREYISLLDQSSDIEHQLFMLRGVPIAIIELSHAVSRLELGEIEHLAKDAWHKVHQEHQFLPLQEEAFAFTCRALEHTDPGDEFVAKDYIERLRAQAGEAEEDFFESGLLDYDRGLMSVLLSRTLAMFLQVVAEPDIGHIVWPGALEHAQSMLARGADLTHYEESVEGVLRLGVRIGVLDNRPSISALDSQFDASPDAPDETVESDH